MNTTGIVPGLHSPNYMTAVPQTTVFLNMLVDVQPDLNITSNVLVLHDETLRLSRLNSSRHNGFRTGRTDQTWSTMLSRLPLQLRYMEMRKNDSLIMTQLADLKVSLPKCAFTYCNHDTGP